jgi:hypothetical protein
MRVGMRRNDSKEPSLATSPDQHGVSGGNSVTHKQVGFTYGANNQLATLDRSVEADSTMQAVVHTAYAWNHAAQPLTTTFTADNATLAEYSRQYDAAGRITQF